MRLPDSLAALVDHGILDEVVRPLMSGKEAQVYLVVSGGAERVAKVYKEAENRTFKHRSDYTEGRKVRNSRDQRAMEKRSRHGRAQDEQAWRSAEVDIIYRLRDAGVRVPQPFHFIDGVLIMELVTDAAGLPAPRLGDLTYTPEEAQTIFDRLITEVTRMLCAGVVHGDLSDFNVLMAADGPVIIDFPQAINAASNQNARRILERDVANLQRFLSRFSPEAKLLPYAQEMWELYQRNALTPDTRLTGRVRAPAATVKTDAVMSLVRDAARDERKRREYRGLDMRGMTPERAAPDQRVPTQDTRARPQDTRAPRPQDTRARPQDTRAPRPQDTRARPQDTRARPQDTRYGAPPREYVAPRSNEPARQAGDRRTEFTPQDNTRQGGFRQDNARQDNTRQGGFRQDGPRQDNTRQGGFRQDNTRQDNTRQGGFRQDGPRQESSTRPQGEHERPRQTSQTAQPQSRGWGPKLNGPFRRDS